MGIKIKKILAKIPSSPGVYIFKNGKGQIIYIGKAINLKKRVSSYFYKKAHDAKTMFLVAEIRNVEYQPTSSGAEALIYEAYLVKEKKPKFNIDLKDDKSYPYLRLTREKFPRLFITREKIKDNSLYYGPYTNVALLRQAIAFMQRVFPLRICNRIPKKACLNYHMGQCIGPCVEPERRDDYLEIVKDVKLFLTGKKKSLIKRISERMGHFSREMDYEKALKCRNQLEALSVVVGQAKHTLPLDSDLKELKDALGLSAIPARIEAFDISNIFGKYAVGSMVTFFNAKTFKDEYRRFRIKTVAEIDDYSMIREVVRRRYKRLLEEKKKMPDLVLVDGGLGHINAASGVLEKLGLRIPMISIAKRNEEIFILGKKEPIILSRRSKALKLIQRVRDEAHRFAISYHRLLRKKGSLGGAT